jgi:hypothetical protein
MLWGELLCDVLAILGSAPPPFVRCRRLESLTSTAKASKAKLERRRHCTVEKRLSSCGNADNFLFFICLFNKLELRMFTSLDEVAKMKS